MKHRFTMYLTDADDDREKLGNGVFAFGICVVVLAIIVGADAEVTRGEFSVSGERRSASYRTIKLDSHCMAHDQCILGLGAWDLKLLPSVR